MKFIFSINFILLVPEVVVCPKNEMLVILSLPLLATSNVLINCKEGRMKLTFGNTMMELNILNLQKYFMGFDDMEHSILN